MRSGSTFVKRVNTRYCAFLLGQSQDVDAAAIPVSQSATLLLACTWQVGGRLGLPVHRQRVRQVECLSAGCGKNEVAPYRASAVPRSRARKDAKFEAGRARNSAMCIKTQSVCSELPPRQLSRENHRFIGDRFGENEILGPHRVVGLADESFSGVVLSAGVTVERAVIDAVEIRGGLRNRCADGTFDLAF